MNNYPIITKEPIVMISILLPNLSINVPLIGLKITLGIAEKLYKALKYIENSSFFI